MSTNNESTTIKRQKRNEPGSGGDSTTSYNVLILGASYGSLLSTKLLLAGHDVTLICREGTAKVFNENGSIVRMPIKGRNNDRIELKSSPQARSPDQIIFTTKSSNDDRKDNKNKDDDDNNHKDDDDDDDDDDDEDDDDNDNDDKNIYDLVVLAMQEPQYSAPDVRKLVQRIAIAKIPVIALTNMPLPPFLARIPGLEKVMVAPSSSKKQIDDDDDVNNLSTIREKIRSCYTDPELWDEFMMKNSEEDHDDEESSLFDVGLFSQCSPDPQAYRPTGESPNVLDVRLPTNFKAARFASEHHTTMLRQMEHDIQGIRYTDQENNNNTTSIELPVKLRVHDSVFVPLAKWAMLLAGNYRCIETNETIISIREAVTRDVGMSRRVYNYVVKLCVNLGGKSEDFVPFDKYLKAAESLKSPSSAAREIASGATNIERVDKIVALIGSIQQEERRRRQRKEMRCQQQSNLQKRVDDKLKVVENDPTNNDDDNDDNDDAYEDKSLEIIEDIVKTVDDWLEKNKTKKV
jgi:hypothetical protein